MSRDEQGAAATRVFIYGSCVSRDSFEHVARDRYVLTRYVARQSLISAYAGPAALDGTDVLTSAFQRRMVEGDAAGDLPRLLAQDAAATDLLLWDLTDERLGVLLAPDGGAVTRSVELVGAGLEPAGDGWRYLAFGTDDHLALWTDALDAFCGTLAHEGLLERTVLLAVPWALTTEDGRAAPSSFGVAPADANARFARYHDAARRRGLTVVEVPPAAVVASAEHRWGPAPFHYSPSTYDAVVALLDDAVGRRPPAGPPKREP